MAIVVLAYSVFVRLSTLDDAFPGGVNGWRACCPNDTFRSDGRICRVSFMTWSDVDGCLDDLARGGISVDPECPRARIAIAKQGEGLLHESDWLEVQPLDSGILVAWDGHHEPSASTRTEHWAWDIEAAGSLSEVNESSVTENREPGVDPVQLDDTQQTSYIGRSYRSLTKEEKQEHNALYERAVGLARELILLDDRAAQPITAEDEIELKRASADLERVVELDPRNWSALFLLGKIHERLGDDNEAFKAFLMVLEVLPTQVGALREASLAAVRLGRFAAAAGLAAKAVAHDSEDPGLRINLACKLVLCGELGPAKAAADNALRMAVDNPRIAAAHTLIVRIASGELPRPTTLEELEGLLVM